MNHLSDDELDMEATEFTAAPAPEAGPEAVGQLTNVPFCESTPVPPPPPPGGRANMGRKRKRPKTALAASASEEGSPE